jgi:hypothetical protein
VITVTLPAPTTTADADLSRPIFQGMSHADLVELAVGLLASEIRLRSELDAATGTTR